MGPVGVLEQLHVPCWVVVVFFCRRRKIFGPMPTEFSAADGFFPPAGKNIPQAENIFPPAENISPPADFFSQSADFFPIDRKNLSTEKICRRKQNLSTENGYVLKSSKSCYVVFPSTENFSVDRIFSVDRKKFRRRGNKSAGGEIFSADGKIFSAGGFFPRRQKKSVGGGKLRRRRAKYFPPTAKQIVDWGKSADGANVLSLVLWLLCTVGFCSTCGGAQGAHRNPSGPKGHEGWNLSGTKST